MGLTNFPHGISSQGVPVFGASSGVVAYRKVYFVDGGLGSDENSGLSVGQAYATIQKALNKVNDEDTIIVMGDRYDEELTTGQNIGAHSAVTLGTAGEGRGRNVTLAGATVTGLPYNSPEVYNESGSTACLQLRSPGWRLAGFRFIGDSGSPICVKMEMNQGGNTADTNWAPGCQIDHCVFLGSPGSTAGLEIRAVVFLRLEDNFFEGFTSSTLGAVEGGASGFAPPGRCTIRRNEFINSVVHWNEGMNDSSFSFNTFHDGSYNTATKGIDLTGGNNNTLWMNKLMGTYVTGGIYTAGTNDNWIGNMVEGTGTGVTAPWSTGDPGQCWIALALYGPSDDFLSAYTFVNYGWDGPVARVAKAVYGLVGRVVAKTPLKWLFKPLFDVAVRRGRKMAYKPSLDAAVRSLA